MLSDQKAGYYKLLPNDAFTNTKPALTPSSVCSFSEEKNEEFIQDSPDLGFEKTTSWSDIVARLRPEIRAQTTAHLAEKQKSARATAALKKSQVSCQQFLSGRSLSFIVPSKGMLVAYSFDRTSEQSRAKQHKSAMQSLRDRISALMGGKERPMHLFPTSGVILPGTFLVLAGADGCGSEVFLQQLAGRCGHMRVRYVCGDELLQNEVERHIAYVSDKDTLPDHITVEEAIRFSARLRTRSGDCSTSKRVDEILRAFRLNEVRHRAIGCHEDNGISKCERRRVSIALDAIADPSLFLLQEPLRALDTFDSLLLLKTLKTLSYSGRTVVISVRTLTPQIVEFADEIAVMSRGFTLYKGPPAQMNEYFTTIGVTIESHWSIVDAVMQVIAPPSDVALLQQHNTLLKHLHGTFRISALGVANEKAANNVLRGQSYQRLPTESVGAAHSPDESVDVPMQRCTRSSTLQLRLLMKRFVLGFVRRARGHWWVGLHLCIVSMLIMMIWSNKAVSEDQKISLVLKYFFFVLSASPMIVSLNLSTTLSERALFRVESERKMYSPGIYFLAQLFVTNLPFAVFVTGVITSTYIFVVGNSSLDCLAFAWLMVSLACCVQSGFLRLLAFVSGNASVTTAILNVIVTYNLLFMGHLVPFSDIPSWLQFCFYGSHVQFALSGLVLNEYNATNATVSRLHPLPDRFHSRWQPALGLVAFLTLLEALLYVVYLNQSRRSKARAHIKPFTTNE